jgi:hypothetical protein
MQTTTTKKDDLIVVAGGFIAGSLIRYFHDRGFTRLRAVDKKPLPDWYQRTPGVECLCLDVSHKMLGWKPTTSLRDGLAKTYAWIEQQYQDRKLGKRTVHDTI